MSTNILWHTRTPGNKLFGSGRHIWAETRNKRDKTQREISITKIWRKEKSQEQVLQGNIKQVWQVWTQSVRFLGKWEQKKKIKNNRNFWFNRKCNNCKKKGHRAVDFWYNKKEKEGDVDNIFVGAILCGEVPKSNKEE